MAEDLLGDDDPQAESPPETCAAAPDGCAIRAGEREGAVQDSQFRPIEELQEALTLEPTVMVPSPLDGMPVPATEQHEVRSAMPFTRESFVCIEDDRRWVAYFDHEVDHAAWAERIATLWTQESPCFLAKVRAYGRDGSLRPRLIFEATRVARYFGHAFVALSEVDIDDEQAIEAFGADPGLPLPENAILLALVRPIRERCEHFVVQVMGNDEQTDPNQFGHRIVFRTCARRRSVGGAYMSLRDEAVYACSVRQPPDPASYDEYIRGGERRQLEASENTELVPLFNLK